ncbi:hypothetical protein H0H87_000705 [Tephrocybe sp. NHM501043]|nr:hypothetical protein H0H87_000705 [Tephrocybe sp. NHM501043]
MPLPLQQPIRLVTFDVLYTIIAPRLPIHVQYAHTFEPYLGAFDPAKLKRSFRVAFRSLEKEQPVYAKGSRIWWSQVIRRTALGAGADKKILDSSLHLIVPRLLDRFSSREGYRAFDDAITVVRSLRALSIRTAVISNADSRIRSVLQDLEFPASLRPIVLSEEEGVEKPSPEIFLRALSAINSRLKQEDYISPEQCLHVGDELDADYNGAHAAGMKALLLRRVGHEDKAHKGSGHLKRDDVAVVEDLYAVTEWVVAYNSAI